MPKTPKPTSLQTIRKKDLEKMEPKIFIQPSVPEIKTAGPFSGEAVFHDSGFVVVTEDGRRAPELEKPWPILWAEHVVSLGLDPTRFKVTTPSGKRIKILKQVDGLTWKIEA